MSSPEYERLPEEEQSLEEMYHLVVERQEGALIEGEKTKAEIRARLGEINRRLAEIRGA